MDVAARSISSVVKWSSELVVFPPLAGWAAKIPHARRDRAW